MDISKGRYWDKPWSCCFSPFSLSFPIGIGDIMFFGMAFKAKCFSVGHFISQFGEFRKWLYVMRVKISAFFIATSLACIVVSLKNCFSPFSIRRTVSCYKIFGSNTSLPIRIIFSIKRAVTTCAFCLAKITKHLFMSFGKGYSFSPFIITVSFSKGVSHSLSYIWRLLFINTDAFVTFNIKSIISRFIRSKLFSGFPFLAFLTSFFGFTKQKIFIKGKTKLPCPSSENSQSLCRYCFHGLSQYYMKGC